MPGAAHVVRHNPGGPPRRRDLTVDDYLRGIEQGNRTLLARAITLIESNAPRHHALARELVNRLLPRTGKSIRIGITGIPGAGKSTFIEAFGLRLCEAGHKVAVLAVDPSSSLTGGSVLGDKTRMENLSRHPNAFIRPSPSGGTLGGVARKSRETMLACEAAGFDVIIVETVGVGQSETTVRSMVDFFLLLAITGAGDELQGLKRGIMELADAIVINKADGDNKPRAESTRQQYEMALHYLQPATDGWKTATRTCSALTGEGVPEVWEMIETFRRITTASGVFEKRRRRQTVEWMNTLLEEGLRTRFLQNPVVAARRAELEREVLEGRLSAAAAVETLLEIADRGPAQ
ncbi:MAG: methylmalonyl Co-A mutase-associated GTPase MeaB [Verrucomicrobia bacterium]|nr:MAG: methylmalonyl Co-A mutase-associated GTPase MeaB [Verrucomicrobiota bacterium]